MLIPFFVGRVFFKSNLSIEEVGQILSQKIFVGIPFEGKDLEIHEEIPAVFIQEPLMGLKVVLDGFSGFDESCGFCLSMHPWLDFKASEVEEYRLDTYLKILLKKSLVDYEEIVIED